MSKTNKKRLFIAGGVVLALGVLGSVIAVASTATNGFGCHGHGDSKMMKRIVLWHAEDMLDEIDADEAQRQVILDTVNKVLAEVEALKTEHHSRESVLLEQLRQGPPNPDEMHSLLDQKFDKANNFAHQTLDRVLEAYSVLRPEQQQIVLDALDKHMKQHQ